MVFLVLSSPKISFLRRLRVRLNHTAAATPTSAMHKTMNESMDLIVYIMLLRQPPYGPHIYIQNHMDDKPPIYNII